MAVMRSTWLYVEPPKTNFAFCRDILLTGQIVYSLFLLPTGKAVAAKTPCGSLDASPVRTDHLALLTQTRTAKDSDLSWCSSTSITTSR
jgi:hypothetical protein